MSGDNATTFTSGMLLPELVSTRGIAAVWVVLAHTAATVVRGHIPLPGAIEYTRIVVDFFFVLSGFVLAHMYDAQWREGRFDHGRFLVRRLARLWPLHMATLFAIGSLLMIGRFVGVEPENQHTFWTFGVTALMLHSSWLTPDLAWNWPSWSISAEWCAYLAIPLLLLVADRIRGVWRRVVFGFGLFAAASLASHLLFGLDVTALTFDGGAFRIIPSFIMGILLRRIFDDEPRLLAMTPRIYAAVVGGVTAVCTLLIALNAPYDALWPAMVALVAALASRATWVEPGVLRAPFLTWLGDLSYSIYLTHAVVIIVMFTSARVLGFGGELWSRVLIGLCVAPVTLIVSQATYKLIEKPGRALVMWIAEDRGRVAAKKAAAREPQGMG